MPILENGCFETISEMRGKIIFTRNVSNAIIRQAGELGIPDSHHAVVKAKADIVEADRIEIKHGLKE